MIDRRSLMAGLTAGACFSSSSVSASQRIPFACGTPQVSKHDRLRSLRNFKNFSSSPTGSVSISARANSLLSFEDFGFALESALWKYHHSNSSSPPGPIQLGVGFIDDPYDMRDQIFSWIKNWTGSNAANLEFFPASLRQSHIRISFLTGQDSSALGAQALSIPKHAPTMHLSSVGSDFGFGTDWNVKNWKRIVLHEFGHAIGLRHEHLHPKAGINWKDDNEIARIELDTANWSRCRLYEQNNRRTSLVRESECLDSIQLFITGTKTHTTSSIKVGSYDSKSIMVYPVKADWNFDGLVIDPAFELSQEDKAFVRDKLYPHP